MPPFARGAPPTAPSQPAAAPVYDSVIIGAGHNDLTCAAYLAGAGLRVRVLKRRPVVDGAAVTEETAPGYRASIFSYLMRILHPRIQRDLDLARHGLRVLPCSELVSPVSREDYIQLSGEVARTRAGFARFSRRDAETYPPSTPTSPRRPRWCASCCGKRRWTPPAATVAALERRCALHGSTAASGAGSAACWICSP